jgi:serine/threonine-protein kinase
LSHLNRLLETALVLEPDQRGPWLEGLSGEDAELRPLVAELLSHAATLEAKDFLGTPPRISASGFSAGPTDPGRQPGTVVGPYRLERELGRGGMGTVWLAHRSDGRFEGQVAIKLLNLALTGGAGAARFRREGSALARLTHPNVARLLDAGVTGTGEPYLVLEYVQGEVIDRWCDVRRCSVRARIGLFLDVAAAVAHAHRHLLLHRDLKPSNILVSEQGTVKLLDFGIAKLLDESADSKVAELTSASERFLTPAYASPEQVEGHHVGVPSDVYALGVLLHVLLCGRHPTAEEGASPVQQMEAVLHREPSRPSSVAARAGPALAGDRGFTPERLARELRGDLDNIVLKALKKGPAERYPTVDAFAEDLRCYLADRPVSARPDSFRYRTQKLLRRHRLGFAAIGLAATGLLTGAVVALAQAQVAREQRDRALRALDRNEAAFGFLDLVLTDTVRADEKITLPELLSRSETLAMKAFQGSPEQQAIVLQMLGVYFDDLGDRARAQALRTRAVELVKTSNDPDLRAELECGLAVSTAFGPDVEASRRTLLSWVSRRDVEPGVAAQCQDYLGQIALMTSDPRGALEHVLAAQSLLRRSTHTGADLRASIHGDLGWAYTLNGRNDEAEQEYTIALEDYRAQGRGDSTGAVVMLNNWGIERFSAGDLPGALELYDQAMEQLKHRSVADTPPPYLVSNRTSALLFLGHYDEALQDATKLERLAKEDANPLFELMATVIRATAHREKGELEESDAALRSGTQVAAGLPPDAFSVLRYRITTAEVALARGRIAQARLELDALLDRLRARGLRTPVLADTLRARAELAAAQGEFEAGLAEARKALAVSQELQGSRKASFHTGLSWLTVASLQQRNGQLEAARQSAQHALEQLEGMFGADHPKIRKAREILAR